MSYDANYLYTRVMNYVNDKALAIAVTASRVDTEEADIAAALTSIGQAALRGPATGDVTTPGGTPQSSVFTIAAGAVTLAKMANLAANSIIGNNTGGAATPIALTAAQVKTLLAVSLTTDVTGVLQAAQEPAHTGDVTNTAGSLAFTIAASAVTLAKMANLAANSIIGNNTGGALTPMALTAAQALTLLATAAGPTTFSGDIILPSAGPTSTLSAGYRGYPTAIRDGSYTMVLSDAGTCLQHDDNFACTWTIPANSSVAFPIGTVIVLDNSFTGGTAVTVAITTDALYRGDGTSGLGSRTIPAFGVATIRKFTATRWVITGTFT